MPHLPLIRWTLSCLLTLLLTTALPARIPDDYDVGNSHWLQCRMPNVFMAVVTPENGRETFDLRVDLFSEYSEGWILVIPSPRPSVSLSWLDQIPAFGGGPPLVDTRDRLDAVFFVSDLTQIYPLLFTENYFHRVGWTAPIPSPSPLENNAGLACTAFSPRSRSELQRALLASNMSIQPRELDSLFHYLDGQHTFVIVHLTSESDYEAVVGQDPNIHVPCLRIQFPSDVPIVPYHLGVGFDQGLCNDEIRVHGYVNPPLGLPLDLLNGPSYQLHHLRGTMTDLRTSTYTENIPYTRWKYQGPPMEVRFTPIPAEAFAKTDAHFAELCTMPKLVALFLLITALSSYLSAGIAGLLVEQRLRAFRGVGLWNFATIIALSVRLRSTYWTSTGLTPAKRRLFLLAFSLIYLTLNHVAALILNNYAAS